MTTGRLCPFVVLGCVVSVVVVGCVLTPAVSSRSRMRPWKRRASHRFSGPASPVLHSRNPSQELSRSRLESRRPNSKDPMSRRSLQGCTKRRCRRTFRAKRTKRAMSRVINPGRVSRISLSRRMTTRIPRRANTTEISSSFDVAESLNAATAQTICWRPVLTLLHNAAGSSKGNRSRAPCSEARRQHHCSQ